MPFSIVRNMASRIAKVGTTQAIMVQAVPAGCSISHLGGVVRVTSLPDANNATAFTSPFACLEYNLTALAVPYSVATAYTDVITNKPGVPDTTADWDKLFERLILNYGQTGSNQYFGGNPDAATAQLDLRKSPKLPESDTDSNTGADDAVADTELGLGPLGIQRIFNYERFINSTTVINLSKTISMPNNSELGTSLSDVVFTDSVDIDAPVNISGPSFLILGVQRFNTDATIGYACTYGSDAGVTPVVPDADRIRGLNALMTGDMLRVKSMLADPSSQLGDYIRTMLFAGDTSIEPVANSNNSVAGQMWASDGFIRDNDIVVNTKYAATMQTPYTIAPDLM